MAVLNGRLPAAMLTAIPGATSRQLLTILVPQVVAFRAAFQVAFGKSLVITDAYRTYEEQVDLKATKGPYAATPGTSKHGWGTALDLGSGVNLSFTSPEHLWVRANGARFGVTHPLWAHNHNPSDGMDEPWHVELTFVPASAYESAPPIPAPLPTPAPEDDVATVALIRTPDQVIWEVGQFTILRLDDVPTALAVAKVNRLPETEPWIEVTQDEFEAHLAQMYRRIEAYGASVKHELSKP